ncbi:MAG: tRNA (adenosine(37)-N6)-threonylcarbamoyltransferase complex ATPase subunit type 1 TsaE [Planctomycetes bacterium]|nr:tRNA (adenosine(37)-N6)-threonylcarbamoyltransferase complex ATPase subunit type 1 TsaE [Planctomycetota bacterium]
MTNEPLTIESHSVEDTLRIGRAIGNALVGGEVIGLMGELGAGKTHLVKGIASGLGVNDDRIVNSPTFVLVNEYAGRVPVYHLDAYRLSDAGQLAALGFDEMCDAGGVVIVEWADRVKEAMPESTQWITLVSCGESDRRITINVATEAMRKNLSA